MNIICPKCGKIHKLVSARLPARKFTANCKQCGARMVVDPLSPPAPGGEAAVEPPSAERPAPPREEFDILLTGDREEGQEAVAVLDKKGAALPDTPPAPEGEEMGGTDDLFTAFPGLRALSPARFSYREIFSATPKQGYRSRENRRLLKTVEAVHDLLTTKILAADEKVRRIARGIAYHPFEIPYANGLMTVLSNYYAIVCTDRRLLLINVNRGLTRPTRYIFQIPYAEIAGIGRGIFLSSLIIRRKRGRGWNFTTVNRKAAESVKNFVAARIDKHPAPPVDTGSSRPLLCPACQAPLPEELEGCPRCGAVFKKRSEALLRSLILPGLGSIYLTYLPLGIMEMTGYLFSWLLTVVLLIFEVPGGLGVAILPVLAYHLAAGLLAWKTAGKGYLLEGPGVGDDAGATAGKGGSNQDDLLAVKDS